MGPAFLMSYSGINSDKRKLLFFFKHANEYFKLTCCHLDLVNEEDNEMP